MPSLATRFPSDRSMSPVTIEDFNKPFALMFEFAYEQICYKHAWLQ